MGTDSVMKSTEPTISKEVVDKDDETVAVGDEVTFRLKAIVPDYPEDATYRKFVVSDKLGTGFDYSGDETIKVFRDEAGQQVIGNGIILSQKHQKKKELSKSILRMLLSLKMQVKQFILLIVQL